MFRAVSAVAALAPLAAATTAGRIAAASHAVSATLGALSVRPTAAPSLDAAPSAVEGDGTLLAHRNPTDAAVRRRTSPSTQRALFSTRAGDQQQYETLASPAPGSPFHHAFPVHDLALAKEFYGNVLGCVEGRSSEKWQDYSLHGHQIVAHWVGNDYRCQDYYNPVDGDEVPVPHTGLALTVEQFHDLADRLKAAGVDFIIEPHLRFEGQPGEQWTMFFKDPSGNNLEFKAMTKLENLFAKYNVVDK